MLYDIRYDIELYKLLEEDVIFEESVGFMKGVSDLWSICLCFCVSECDVFVVDYWLVFDLKEEEEIKMIGIVIWWFYWDYFKVGVLVFLIIFLVFVLIVV